MRVRLNVGGTRFETTTETLRAAGPDTFLARLADHAENGTMRTKDKRGRVFIDRDPELFKRVLTMLRGGSFTLEREPDDEMMAELDFYGIEYVVEQSRMGRLLDALHKGVVTFKQKPDAACQTALKDAGVAFQVEAPHERHLKYQRPLSTIERKRQAREIKKCVQELLMRDGMSLSESAAEAEEELRSIPVENYERTLENLKLMLMH